MNVEILIRGGVDYHSGVKRFMGDAELYETVLQQLLLSDTAFDRACRAYEKRDGAALRAAAHELKGACGSADITPVYEEAAKLVVLLRQPTCDWEEIAPVFDRFSQACQTARRAIEQASSPAS